MVYRIRVKRSYSPYIYIYKLSRYLPFFVDVGYLGGKGVCASDIFFRGKQKSRFVLPLEKIFYDQIEILFSQCYYFYSPSSTRVLIKVLYKFLICLNLTEPRRVICKTKTILRRAHTRIIVRYSRDL